MNIFSNACHNLFIAIGLTACLPNSSLVGGAFCAYAAWRP